MTKLRLAIDVVAGAKQISNLSQKDELLLEYVAQPDEIRSIKIREVCAAILYESIVSRPSSVR